MPSLQRNSYEDVTAHSQRTRTTRLRLASGRDLHGTNGAERSKDLRGTFTDAGAAAEARVFAIFRSAGIVHHVMSMKSRSTARPMPSRPGLELIEEERDLRHDLQLDEVLTDRNASGQRHLDL